MGNEDEAEDEVQDLIREMTQDVFQVCVCARVFVRTLALVRRMRGVTDH